MEKLKTGLIGLGRMGAEDSIRLNNVLPKGWLPISHIENIYKNEYLDLTSICDIDKEKLNYYSQKYLVDRKYKSYYELISKEKLDFLSIATRIDLKKDILEHAIKNDIKIIYVEKPLFQSIGEAKRILKDLEKKNILLGYGVNRRYHDVYISVKELIKTGEFGNLNEIIIENNFSTLFWTHPHSIDLLLFFSNSKNITEIQGSIQFRKGYQPKTKNFIDDDPFVENACIKFDNEIIGKISNGVGYNVRLLLSKGTISIIGDGKEVIVRKINSEGYLGKSKELKFDIKVNSTTRIFNNLCNSYFGKEKIMIEKNDILLNTQLLFGILFSSNLKSSKIKLDEIPNELICSGYNGKFFA